MEFISETRRAH